MEEPKVLSGIKLNKSYPDLVINIDDIVFSKPRLIEDSQVYVNATVHNLGNLGATATVKFYDGEPDSGLLIGQTTIDIAALDSNVASIQWHTGLGYHNIHVLIEDSVPEEPFTQNNLANRSIVVEARPVLTLTIEDVDIFRFESGEERTLPVYVSCHNNSATNVRLIVLDDRGLTISVETPPQDMDEDGSFVFNLLIKAPELKENRRVQDIRLQVISDETVGNEESMDILVKKAPGEFLGWFILLGFALAFGGTVGVFGGTEFGKYALFAAIAPLYTRFDREDILTHETRGMIRGYIMANPGEHYNSIKRALGLKNGTLAYHLKRLEKERFIKSVRDGRYKRFYPSGMKVPEEVFRLNKIQEIILGIIVDRPGISQKDLADMVGLSRSTINYHIGVMSNAGFVRVERKGRYTRCYQGNGVA